MPLPQIAIVVPAYRVKQQIVDLVLRIGPEASHIYVIDDACPEQSGQHIRNNIIDPRVKVLWHQENQGVGGAVMTGYAAALADGCKILVKLDGDGQMDPAFISTLVRPIVQGEADYTKGNRFFDLDGLQRMPPIRLFGNTILSLLTKFSSGYWDIFDPTNGFTAIHSAVAARLPLGKISKRYFFETDMLFRLNILRAVVVDVPMHAQYGDETSNLSIGRIVPEFLYKHLRNLLKRIFYNYYLRDMSLGSLQLPLGLLLLLLGLFYGLYQWFSNAQAGLFTSSGSVMLSALPIMVGIQLILAFFSEDIQSVPRRVIHVRIASDV